MKNLRKTLFTGLATCLILLSLGMSDKDSMLNQLDKATMEIVRLGILVSEQKQTITELTAQVVEYKYQSKNDRIALEPMRFFRDRNDIDFGNMFQFDIDHMKYLLSCIDKYEYLLSKDSRESIKKDSINIRHFMLAWPAKESHYNKFARHVCENGSVDVGLYQINKGINSVVWKDLYSRLPEDVKKLKDPENNVDVGVCLMYLWINDRVKLKWSWALLSYKSDSGKMQDWAWTLYWRLNQI